MAAPAAVIEAITCFLHILLVSGSIATRADWRYDIQLQVFSEVVSGPARDRPLGLHLDAALPVDVWRAILGVEAVQHTPHLTLSLSSNHSHGRRPLHEAAALQCSSCSSSMLHVVLWLTPQPDLLQALWLYWKPRNLLLFNLGSSLGADVLLDEALSRVEKLTLIGPVLGGTDLGTDALVVYTVLPFSSSSVQLLGPWRREFFSNWEALFPDRFPTFEGYTFHIGSRLLDQPFFFPNVRDPLKRDGVAIDMLQSLSAKLNFTYTATNNTPDSKWGALSNGFWNGVLGMLQRREKNFTINSFLLDIDRGRDFDFSTPIHVEGFGAYLRIPEPLPNWTSIAKVFQYTIWLAVLFAFVASICFALLQDRVREGWTQSLSSNRRARDLFTICMDIQRPLMGQSIPYLPPVVPLRILMAMWFVLCLVVTVAYTSNLVGIFTRPVYLRRLQDLQEIIDNTYRVVMVDSDNIMSVALKVSEDHTLRRLGKNVDHLPTQEDCIDTMMEGTHVFLDRPLITTAIKTHKSSGTCYMVGEQLLTSPMVWFFPKHTPWKYKFDQVIQHLLSGGLVHYWMQDKAYEITEAITNRNDHNSQQQESRGDNNAVPLTLQHFQGILFILAIVWGTSGIVLLLELFIHHHKHLFVACRAMPSN